MLVSVRILAPVHCSGGRLLHDRPRQSPPRRPCLVEVSFGDFCVRDSESIGDEKNGDQLLTCFVDPPGQCAHRDKIANRESET